MNQPQMNQPQPGQQESPQPDTAGFTLIEQLLREKVAGDNASAAILIDGPLESLKTAAANPRLQRDCQAVAAGFEKVRELLEIMAGHEKS